MNDHTLGIWKRPWNGAAKCLAWYGLLALAILVVFLGVSLAMGPSPKGSEVLGMALASALLAGLLAVATLFVRWLCCGRNLPRFLLGVAGFILVVVLGYVEEDWRGSHAWQRHERLLAARGEPLTLTSLVPPAVPDSRNFALTPLLAPVLDYYHGPAGQIVWGDTNGIARVQGIAAELTPHRSANDHLVMGRLDAGTFTDLPACALFYRGNTNYPQAAPEAAPAQVILTALGRFGPELKELREAAAARPESRFPVHYEEVPSWGILLPHLSRVKSLTMLCQMRATALLDAGQPAAAFDDLSLGLRLSDSLRSEPLLIDHLVRIAALGFDLQTVREGLLRHAWSEGQLTEIEGYLAQVNLLAEYKHVMYGERACATEGIDYLRRRGFRADPDALSAIGGGEGSPALRLIPSGMFRQNMLTISRFFEDLTLPAVDERARRVSPELSMKGQRAIEEMRRGPYTLMAKLLLPALGNAVRKSAVMQTYLDATRVGCALERHRLANGKLPASLDGLVPRFLAAVPSDVINGRPLRYRPDPDGGYVVYSVGWNQTDDGGVLAWSKETEAKRGPRARRLGVADGREVSRVFELPTNPTNQHEFVKIRGIRGQLRSGEASLSCYALVHRVCLEKAADRARDHQFFIRAHDAHRDATGRRGNQRRVLRVAGGVEFDAEVAESFAYASANGRAVFPNAGGEHQRVQSAEGGGKCADPFLDLIAKQRDRLGRPRVAPFTFEQVAHVGAGLRHAEQAGLEIDEFVELLGAHFFGARQVPNESGIEVAGARAHGHPGRRGEGHARIRRGGRDGPQRGWRHCQGGPG